MSSAQGPQPKLREIATIPGVTVGEVVRLPNGRVLLYTVGDSIVAHDITTKRHSLVTRGSDGEITISAAGDRIAYTRNSEADPNIDFIWSLRIDRTTGAAAGPAQRVSLSAGFLPSFSPDGKSIAYARWNPGRERNLAVVPVTGGPERVLATYQSRIGATSWSSDGKWVFARVEGDTSRSIQRVPAAGGRSETVLSYSRPHSYDAWIDPSIALFPRSVSAANQGRLQYHMATGAHGEFRIPPSTGPANGMGSAITLWANRSTPSLAHVLNLVDGTIRTNLPTTLATNPSMAWSPDGRQLAFQTGNMSFEITVMNADGSAQRRYQGPLPAAHPVAIPREQKLATNGERNFVAWSPDQTTLAWRGPSGTRIILLDLASGNTRSLTTSAGTIGDFAWRPDSKSIVVFKAIDTPEGASAHTGVFEILLDGSERLLRDLSAEYPWAPGARMPSDSVVLIGNLAHTGRFFSLPIRGGAARQISMPGADSGARLVGYSSSRDGRWAFAGIAARGHLTHVLLMSTSGDSTRTVSLPFEGVNAGMTMLPDGRNLLIAGRTATDTVLKLFKVPIDGGQSRVFAGIPEGFAGIAGPNTLSPDGRLLVFLSRGQPTSTIYELDMSPILQSAGKR